MPMWWGTAMAEEQRLAEYRAYYRARAARFAANPLYPATAAAEAALADAVEAARSMADLQAGVVGGELALACGRALARDQASARAALYARTAETVRAQGPAEVLAGIDAVGDAAALASLAGGAEQRAAQAVTVDELTRLWTLSLAALENIEVWQTARVPSRWTGELHGYGTDAARAERDAWARVVAEAQAHQPGWRLDDGVARAARHRRLVPVPDGAFERRLAQHRAVARGEGG
jgi:hypothetical protein